MLHDSSFMWVFGLVPLLSALDRVDGLCSEAHGHPACGVQVKNPGRDIPLGMTLALCIVTTLYLLCS